MFCSVHFSNDLMLAVLFYHWCLVRCHSSLVGMMHLLVVNNNYYYIPLFTKIMVNNSQKMTDIYKDVYIKRKRKRKRKKQQSLIYCA